MRLPACPPYGQPQTTRLPPPVHLALLLRPGRQPQLLQALLKHPSHVLLRALSARCPCCSRLRQPRRLARLRECRQHVMFLAVRLAGSWAAAWLLALCGAPARITQTPCHYPKRILVCISYQLRIYHLSTTDSWSDRAAPKSQGVLQGNALTACFHDTFACDIVLSGGELASSLCHTQPAPRAWRTGHTGHYKAITTEGWHRRARAASRSCLMFCALPSSGMATPSRSRAPNFSQAKNASSCARVPSAAPAATSVPDPRGCKPYVCVCVCTGYRAFVLDVYLWV